MLGLTLEGQVIVVLHIYGSKTGYVASDVLNVEVLHVSSDSALAHSVEVPCHVHEETYLIL